MIEIGKILGFLREQFSDAILETETQYDFEVVTIQSDSIIPVIAALKNHPEFSFEYLTTLCGIHYPDKSQIAVMYQLHSLSNNIRIRLKTYLSEESPTVRSLTSVFKSANWMEREAYDFYGIHFEGHPDLRRILNVETMIAFPMRKEFPLEDQIRTDKEDKMFGR
ncbi:MAG: NADH-quinone oxidoreductase subunit C [Saprospiraceae bacterium]